MSEIRATTISDLVGTGPVTLTGQSAAKAWSNLNGTGTIAERDSFNISGYVDNGTGDYTFTFTTAFASADWASGGYAGRNLNGGTIDGTWFGNTSTIAAGSHRTLYAQSGSAAVDVNQAQHVWHGDLA
jgi:ABC-type molybdate transport system substrate-binding protein